MTIKIIVTGGTFDKEYNEIKGELFFRDTHINEMLTLGRCRVEYKIKKLMMIDSLFMKKSHRLEILKECMNSREKNIVITHGTDTMVDTAKVLGENVESIKNKTVVLTGAMIPYKFGSSDGMFNLGSAISFAQVLPPGVYIAMNGRYFNWYNVTKNRSKGEFEEVK
ncbi:MAG: asparaginase [Elusimicrobiales bacterium]|nr:asparaginase [Elusimicrobiales bacterium]